MADQVVIGFTGHRNRWCDPARLHALAQEFPGSHWVHGDAEGFDTQVRYFLSVHGPRYGLTSDRLRPDYDRYPPKIAPLVRDQEIVARAHFMVACWDGRLTGGTYETRKYAEDESKVIRDWEPDPVQEI